MTTNITVQENTCCIWLNFISKPKIWIKIFQIDIKNDFVKFRISIT